jgi:uncharacterized protein involved in exopolysaccharide biosynthesis
MMSPDPTPRPGLTFGDVAVSLGARRGRLILVTLGVAVLAAVVLMLLPPVYTARTSVVPESKGGSSVGQLAGLAALAGLNLPAGAGAPAGQTPQFYASLLTSRPIVYAVLERRYSTAGLGDRWAGQDSATLTDILLPAGTTPELRRWNAAKSLAGRAAAQTDLRTGIVTLTVKHRSPALAAAVAEAFVQELERFNLERRHSQAGARRQFIDDRLLVVADDLRTAEDALHAFLLRNREYEQAPTLRFEYGRLERALSVQQELYLQLRRELDAARIAEVDNVPAITTIEPALVPQRRSGPPRRPLFALAVLLALGVQVSWALLLDHHARVAPGLAPAMEALAPRWAARRRRRSQSQAA